jgi:Xaa-Pro aminopeptidase
MTDRLQRLRSAIAGAQAEAALISHPTNRRYFSGFPAGDHAPDESSGVLLVTHNLATLFTSSTNLPWAAGTVRPSVNARPWSRPWQNHVGEQIRELGLRRVGFEDVALTVADHAVISAAAGNDVEFVPLGDAVHAIRSTKDPDEIKRIAEAARITDEAFAETTAQLQAGITERELAWNLEQAMHRLGATGVGFPIIVAAGPHGARPHHDPTSRTIAEGEPVVIDMGAQVDGYSADLTRTIVIGQADSTFRERYASVLEAQLAALSGIRPGMTGREADAIARDGLARSGLREAFVHGLGHGVGLLVHESPSLGTTSTDVLQPGQIVTIEPGIYEDGWGGIRIEDLCVVTDSGLEVLSAAAK